MPELDWSLCSFLHAAESNTCLLIQIGFLSSQVAFSLLWILLVGSPLLFCSTELMRRVRRFQIAQYKCLVIKYAKDTRYCTNGVSTHDR